MKPLDSSLPPVLRRPSWEIPGPDVGRATPEGPVAVRPEEDFGRALRNAVDTVDTIQLEGDAQAHALGGGAGNLHETMLALEKADITMRLATKVRTKLVDAYNEVMRMSV